MAKNVLKLSFPSPPPLLSAPGNREPLQLVPKLALGPKVNSRNFFFTKYLNTKLLKFRLTSPKFIHTHKTLFKEEKTNTLRQQRGSSSISHRTVLNKGIVHKIYIFRP